MKRVLVPWLIAIGSFFAFEGVYWLICVIAPYLRGFWL